MVARTDNFSSILAPGLRKVYSAEFNMIKNEYTEVANILNTTRNYEDDRKIVMLSTLLAKSEGTAVTYQDPVESGTKRYTPSTFALGFRVTQEMWEDDLYAQMRKASRSLARAAQHNAEVQGIKPVNDMFDTSFAGFESAVSLASTAHVIVRSGATAVNRPAVEVDLSYAALQAGVENFDNTLDDNGLPAILRPKTLLITVQNKWLARELLGSSHKPFTANNEINPLMDEDLSWMISHYQTDADAWSLWSGKDQHDYNVFWRIRPQFSSSDDFDTGDAKFKVRQRLIAGFGEWRGVYASNGA